MTRAARSKLAAAGRAQFAALSPEQHAARLATLARGLATQRANRAARAAAAAGPQATPNQPATPQPPGSRIPDQNQEYPSSPPADFSKKASENEGSGATGSEGSASVVETKNVGEDGRETEKMQGESEGGGKSGAPEIFAEKSATEAEGGAPGDETPIRDKAEAEKDDTPKVTYRRTKLYGAQSAAFFGPERWSFTEGTTKAGKTAGLIVWLGEQAILGKADQNFWWVAPVSPVAAIAYRRMAKAIPYNLRTTHDTLQRITLVNGAHIWFKSAEKPDNLYGEDVYAAAIDEGSRCFVAGTMVDTPEGQKKIESIKSGDFVKNAIGTGKVTRTIKKRATKIAIVMVDGRSITCSHDHRFFTDRGWIEAYRLSRFDRIVTQSEAVRNLRNAFRSQKQCEAAPILLKGMFQYPYSEDTSNARVPDVREKIHGQSERQRSVLWDLLLREVENVTAGDSRQSLCAESEGQDTRIIKEVLVEGHQTGSTNEGGLSGEELDALKIDSRKSFFNHEAQWRETENSRRQRNGDAGNPSSDYAKTRGGFLCGIFRKYQGRRMAPVLSDRCGVSGKKNSRGDRWTFAPKRKEQEIRSKKGRKIESHRVEGVEIYESGSDQFNAISGGKDFIELFDLSVSGHPSFSVNGLLVHNCREESWHAIRTTLSATKGKCRIIGNVKGRRNWFFRLCRKAESGASKDSAYHKLTWRDAVAAGILDVAEVEDAKAQLPPAVFQELYEAEASDDTGCPFGLKAIEACTTGISRDPAVCWGWDFARKHDYCAGIGLDRLGRVCAFERFQMPWKQAIPLIREKTNRLPALVDSTGIGDVILGVLAEGPGNFEGYIFSQRSKQNLMEALTIDIQTGKAQFPDGPIRNELETFEYSYTRTGVSYAAPDGMFDDCVCALALARWHHKAGHGLLGLGGVGHSRIPSFEQSSIERGYGTREILIG